MDWIQATITTTTEGIEPVTGRLYQLGINGVEIEDEKDLEEFLAGNTAHWDYVDEAVTRKFARGTRVKIYLPGDAAGNEQLLAVRDSLAQLRALDGEGAFGSLTVTLVSLSEEDWANNWKQYFKPIAVGRNILIKPEWEPLPPGCGGKTVFTVDPGMTFGTGAHETTRLCIEALERRVKPGDHVLDLGSGSGILSIIALLLGASDAVAVDIDPITHDIAMENARRNGIGADRFTVLTGNVLTDEALRAEIGARRYPVVAANIVADVIIALAPFVPALLSDGGAFVCSGVIVERKGEVADALRRNGFTLCEEYAENGWAAMVCERR